MRLKTSVVLVALVFLIFINFGLTLAEEDVVAVEQGVDSENAEQNTVSESKAGPEIQWLWGEVASVDPQNKKVIAKYLDYETDSEKEISLFADDQTTYENIKSLDELKTLNTISVDYGLGPDGQYLIKNLSVEKIDGPPAIAEPQKQAPAVEQPKVDQSGKSPAQASAE
ncbi:hypothetical protein D4R78_01010 [bacterium]|nr:MAG: hypothetical protein D4R78_01010 [bacterium]